MSESKKLRLRRDVRIIPLAYEHAEKMFQWMKDPTVNANIGSRAEPSIERTRAWIENARTDRAIRPYAILLEDVHVGTVVLDRIDTYLATARLSVYIGESAVRGSGVGTTALYHVLAEAFTTEALNKVWLTVHERNVTAMRSYFQVGFALEGILREEFVFDSERIAAIYMGVLARDFARLTPVE